MHRGSVHLKDNETANLELVASDACCDPSPADFITGEKDPEGVDGGERRGQILGVDVDFFAGVGELAKLLPGQ